MMRFNILIPIEIIAILLMLVVMYFIGGIFGVVIFACVATLLSTSGK